MPIVDKLAALLREDLESAFEDDLDSIFSVTELRHSLGQKKRELEIELKQVDSLWNRFILISQLQYHITTLIMSLQPNILLLNSDEAFKREIHRNK